MKVVRVEVLVARGRFSQSPQWSTIQRELRTAVRAVVWPPGSRSFRIFPKKHGNGVKPIKEAFVSKLKQDFGWDDERKLRYQTRKTPGKIDAVKALDDGLFAVEWETGNVSSSHRAINKIALGIQRRQLVGGALIVPTSRLYPYLTDRVGNYDELEPYFDLWRSLECDSGVLAVLAVEHDRVSQDVPLIKKGTDGRALL
ncbi:MAG: restriction endonuclease [bacterium]